MNPLKKITNQFIMPLALLILLVSSTGNLAKAQSMGISSSSITPDASSILELRSTAKGILIPRMATTDRDAISSPATGLLVFNTTTGKFNFYDGSTWVPLFTGITGVNSITGTSNRIAIGGTSADPTVDISSSYTGQTSLTTLGTVATGTWNGTLIDPTYGGTGVNNGSNTITLGGNLTTSGAFATTLTSTAATSVTLPTTGTLATLAGTETFTNKTISGASNTITNIDASSITGTLGVANGGTGQTSFTNGQLLIGNSTGNTLAKSTLTAGTGISITNAGGSITIANSSPSSGGTVTSASVVSANGFAGTVANASTTPALTLSTTVTGVIKGNGTAISAATSGTDYSAGTSALATGIVKSTTTTGALSIAVAGDFPTLNQNTTGTATKATNLIGGNATTLLGSVPYQSNTDVTSLLSPNTTTTKKFLNQTGDGTNGAAPVWGTIAAGDVPTLNQNTTGSAATLTTSRNIYGNAFNGSADLAQIIASTYGGTGNGFTKFTGPGTAEKTFTLPNASATILTDNATVTAAQGGTGIASYTVGDMLYASASTTLSKLNAVAAGSFLRSAGTSTAPVWSTTTLPNSSTTGDLLYASAGNTYSNLAGVATGNALISGGTSTAPSWGKIGLTTHVSGILPIANGGTNSTATPTNGGVAYGDGSAHQFSAAGTSGQVLQSAGAASPVWVAGGTMMITGNTNNQQVNNNTFYYPASGTLSNTNNTDVQAATRSLVSRTGTLKNLYVIIGVALAAGKTGTVTVMKNGVATSLVATLSVGPVAFNDLTHTVSLAAGDEIGVKLTTTDNVKFSWAMDFTY